MRAPGACVSRSCWMNSALAARSSPVITVRRVSAAWASPGGMPSSINAGTTARSATSATPESLKNMGKTTPS